VNHYLKTCKKAGKKPQKAFKGLFPARINPEIHKKAALVALQRKISLKLVELAIEHEIEASH
jgi:predicted HicB family RNase H-like nuclease